MKITSLTENTSFSPEFKHVHGLSFYIETKNHKILFDMGPDSTFIDNAGKLGIKLEDVDTAIISHGHNDHGGALALFMDINKNAKIYVREDIFGTHLRKDTNGFVNIGLDKSLSSSDRFVFTGDSLKIDDELFIFSSVKGRKHFSKSNGVLYAEKNNEIQLDDFTHEQSLIITEGDKKVLIGGCAHNGIVNIIEKAHELGIKNIHTVISGFHLMIPDENKSEDPALVKAVAKDLIKFGSQYYTCHCTGIESYKVLKEAMGNQVKYISSGMSIEL